MALLLAAVVLGACGAEARPSSAVVPASPGWLPPQARPKTAVLVHGYHLETANWEEVVWGNGGGRAAHGARIGVAFGAEVFMIGSGASTHAATGETEGAYTLRWLRERSPRGGALGSLLEGAVVDAHSQNTREELEHAAVVCVASGVNRIFLVSSPAHCARVARDAGVVFRRLHPSCEVFVAPCKTDFVDVDDVAVLEPSHRPDRDSAVALNRVAIRALGLSPHKRRAFAAFANNYLDDLDMTDEAVDVAHSVPLGPPADGAGLSHAVDAALAALQPAPGGDVAASAARAFLAEELYASK